MAWFLVIDSASLGFIKNVNSYMSDTSIFSSLRYKTRSYLCVLLKLTTFLIFFLIFWYVLEGLNPKAQFSRVATRRHCRKHRQGAPGLVVLRLQWCDNGAERGHSRFQGLRKERPELTLAALTFTKEFSYFQIFSLGLKMLVQRSFQGSIVYLPSVTVSPAQESPRVLSCQLGYEARLLSWCVSRWYSLVY